MIASVALLVTTLVLRSAAANRHVKARLTTTAVVCAVYAFLAALILHGRLSEGLQAQLRLVLPLLAAFGFINALVALAVNPWRVDRLPDRFPTIVQDAIVIVLFGFAATLLLQEKIFAATAVGAVVLGLALQDTLGNLFAGLAIQIEKPFRVGHWVRIADIDGLVSEVTWRATKVRTKGGNFVIVPNSKLADDIIINYSEPSLETRVEVEVGVHYDCAPNTVKRVIRDALRDEPLLVPSREPEVLIVDFASSSVNYRVRVWTTAFSEDERLRDRIRSAIYYAFRRHNIVIPYPIQTEIQKEDQPPSPRDFVEDEARLREVAIFAALSDEERSQLARSTTRSTYAAGEVIVRQGEVGASMFIVATGEVVVVTEPGAVEIARIGPGGFFGEMSLLTGAPRNATVRMEVDSDLLEITVEAFRRFVLKNPTVVEQVGLAVASRRAELEHRRAAGQTAAPAEAPQSFMERVRRFLGLS